MTREKDKDSQKEVMLLFLLKGQKNRAFNGSKNSSCGAAKNKFIDSWSTERPNDQQVRLEVGDPFQQRRPPFLLLTLLEDNRHTITRQVTRNIAPGVFPQKIAHFFFGNNHEMNRLVIDQKI